MPLWRKILSLPLISFITIVNADLPPYENSRDFDDGQYGGFPTQKFFSSWKKAPRLNFIKPYDQPDDSMYTMLAPRGWEVGIPGPMLLDDWGNLVWSTSGYPSTYNLRVQQFKGEDVLTFWDGDDGVRGHGAGHYYMYDKHYNLINKISASNTLKGDLHEFTLTNHNTAILTAYQRRKVSLASVPDSPRTYGYIWDCFFQEKSLSDPYSSTREEEKVLFEWRASDHFNLTESYNLIQNRGSHRNPYDWFHINSIEKDHLGNYLISARYTCALTYVSGKTGEILWNLGGKRNDFLDLSTSSSYSSPSPSADGEGKGPASDFCFQHDARWLPPQSKNLDTISLFDNAADDLHRSAEGSRGMIISLNTTSFPKTVALEKEYISPSSILSLSQGSMQSLPNGNFLIGWGFAAAYTEFAPNGSVVADARLVPLSQAGTGNAQTYRVMKFQWKGYPKTKPSLAFDRNNGYVSWNGATEVMEWMLQTNEGYWWQRKGKWREVVKVRRAGFETEIPFEEDKMGKYARVLALDKDGELLGVGRSVDWSFARLWLPQLLLIPDFTTFIIILTTTALSLYFLFKLVGRITRKIAMSTMVKQVLCRCCSAREQKQKSQDGLMYMLLPSSGRSSPEGLNI